MSAMVDLRSQAAAGFKEIFYVVLAEKESNPAELLKGDLLQGINLVNLAWPVFKTIPTVHKMLFLLQVFSHCVTRNLHAPEIYCKRFSI